MAFSLFKDKNESSNESFLKNSKQDPGQMLQDIPIHTMKKDLEEITNAPKENSANPAPVSKTIAPPTLTPPQPPRISQFPQTPQIKQAPQIPQTPRVPQSQQIPRVPQGLPTTQNISNTPAKPNFQPNKNSSLGPEKEKNKPLENEPRFVREQAIKIPEKSEFGFKKALTLALVIVIMFLLGGGTYYFIISRQTPIQETQETTQGTQETQPAPPENIKPQPEFSIDKPNYLSIDAENVTELSFRESLKGYAEKIRILGIQTPIEFLITDQNNNNPIPFSNFSQKIGMAFSANINTSLSENFSLFLYNDNGNISSGIVIDSIDENQLAADFKIEEPKLFPEIKPIFLVSEVSDSTKQFANGESYKELKVRFKNIISPTELSIDWAVINAKLYIGTTKQTIRSIYDYTVQNATPIISSGENSSISSTEPELIQVENMPENSEFSPEEQTIVP